MEIRIMIIIKPYSINDDACVENEMKRFIVCDIIIRAIATDICTAILRPGGSRSKKMFTDT